MRLSHLPRRSIRRCSITAQIHKEAESEEQLPYKNYLDYRDKSLEARQRAEQRLDQLVVGGASGALVLSMTFLEQIAPNPLASTRFLLAGSWLTLLFALLFALVSHVASAKAMGEQIRKADAKQRGDTPKSAKKRWAKAVEILNFASIASFIIGVAALALFAYLNVTFH